MGTAAVQFYDVVLWIHITAVVTALGPAFAYAAIAAIAVKEGLRASLGVERAIFKLNMTGTTYGMVVILLSGLYVAGDRWSFGDFFVSWGVIAILVLFGIVHGYFLPRQRRLIAGLEAEVDAAAGDAKVERSGELRTLDREIERMGIVAGIVIVLTIYVMTAKPFL